MNFSSTTAAFHPPGNHQRTPARREKLEFGHRVATAGMRSGRKFHDRADWRSPRYRVKRQDALHDRQAQPVPPDVWDRDGSTRKKRSNTLGSASVGMPSPVSETRSESRRPRSRPRASRFLPAAYVQWRSRPGCSPHAASVSDPVPLSARRHRSPPAICPRRPRKLRSSREP